MGIRKVFLILLIIFLLTLEGLNQTAAAIPEKNKIIIVVVDILDFEIMDKIIEDNSISVGLMNIKTGNIYKNNSHESFFMTIAASRRVKVEEGLFKGVKKENSLLNVEGYHEIVESLRNKYVDFSREIVLFGEYFKERGIALGYIGKDSSSLVCADSNGTIDYGENQIIYDSKWMEERTHKLLEKVDVLIISYNFRDNGERIIYLRDYIKKFNEYYIIVFPKDIKGDINVRWNTSLVPVLYNTPDKIKGLLTSNTTRRRGVITNLDIFPNTAFLMGYDISEFIGKQFQVIPSSNATGEIKDYIIEFLNLNILKYALHGMVIILQLYVISRFNTRKQKNRDLNVYIMNGIIIGIFLSFILGILHFQKSIILYLSVIIILSAVLSRVLIKRDINVLSIFSILTNMVILWGVFKNEDIIYNSYIGYNNIVAGGRFFGLNNEVMGVLLVTSIISYYYIKGLCNNNRISRIFLITYFPIIVISLSSRFGANVGGYFGSVVLFLMMIYREVFGIRNKGRNFVMLACIGLLIFALNLYIEINSVEVSHIGNLILRTELLGWPQFVGALTEKIKQFFVMIVIPPWSIILVGQFYFITRYYKNHKELVEGNGFFIIFAAAVIVLLINDTGVISFAYMNTYLITHLISLHKIKKRTFYQ